MSAVETTDEPATPEPGDGGLVRLRVDLAYDGTAFSGWARQPGRRTVQGELETALATILRLPAVAVTVAGRTDAGVHATAQACHLDVDAHGPAATDPGGLLRRLRRLLPDDVAVHDVRVVPPEFDARFAALRRHYEYRVCDRPAARDPRRRHDTLGWPRPLDEAAMNAAAARLLGEHDFAAFCKRREGATTVRELQRLEWSRAGGVGDGVHVGVHVGGGVGGGVLTCHVSADAFCHNMVRSLVGALIAVGEDRKPVEWPAEVLRSGVRASDVAPAHGLTLVGVDYPPDAELAARAARTRTIRALGAST